MSRNSTVNVRSTVVKFHGENRGMCPEDLRKIKIKFHGSLNDFLPKAQRRKFFHYSVKGHPAIKDTIEALRVPHPEVGYILANKRMVNFSFQARSDDRLEIFPNTGAGFLVGKRKCLSARLPARRRFVLDSHLGKLARHLRLLGFDVVYKNFFPDQEIIRISNSERRIILTRDIGLLKNGEVRWGYWLRSTDPLRQFDEIVARYGLLPRDQILTRCPACNGFIREVKKSKVDSLLPPEVRKHYRKFYCCRSCRKLYWRGTHYAQIRRIIARGMGNKRRGRGKKAV